MFHIYFIFVQLFLILQIKSESIQKNEIPGNTFGVFQLQKPINIYITVFYVFIRDKKTKKNVSIKSLETNLKNKIK